MFTSTQKKMFHRPERNGGTKASRWLNRQKVSQPAMLRLNFVKLQLLAIPKWKRVGFSRTRKGIQREEISFFLIPAGLHTRWRNWFFQNPEGFFGPRTVTTYSFKRVSTRFPITPFPPLSSTLSLCVSVTLCSWCFRRFLLSEFPTFLL